MKVYYTTITIAYVEHVYSSIGNVVNVLKHKFKKEIWKLSILFYIIFMVLINISALMYPENPTILQKRWLPLIIQDLMSIRMHIENTPTDDDQDLASASNASSKRYP
jgi:hypothetical protein